MASKRPFIAAANWKMNKNPNEVETFFQKLEVPSTHSDLIVIFPPALLAQKVQQFIPKKSYFKWGGQNCHFEKAGAFTGENSPETLALLGATWVLVGHSERRTLFGESDALIAKKISAAQGCGLTPLLCVGESLAERESQKTNSVIEKQLREGLKLASPEKKIAIAYEPVWAIGTGQIATAQQVSDAHSYLRKTLNSIWSNFADAIPILYGGSVNPQNCRELAIIPNVDGFLVGGASLKPETFGPIAGLRKD